MPDFSFQPIAVKLVHEALQEHRSVLLVSPTGSGKTKMATMMIPDLPGPVMMMSERREIVQQTEAAMQKAGLETITLTAQSRTDHGLYGALGGRPDVVVASQRTAWSRAVRAGHDIGEYGSIIVDECHHINADTYVSLLEKWPNAKIVGLTATPERGDGRGLGNHFEIMIQSSEFDASTPRLIERGVLVPCYEQHIWSWPVDLSKVKTQAGDYAMGGKQGASNVLDTPKLVGNVVKHWKALGQERQTICYATSVAHAEHLAEQWKLSEVNAAVVHSGTPQEERESILFQLAFGDITVVCNFGVLTEGFDCPPVSCIVLVRPTKLHGLYRQMVGRGLRACDGKEDMILLDHGGIVPMHGLPSSPVRWSLTTTGKAAQKKEAKPKICPECGSLAMSKKGVCGACGYQEPPLLRRWDAAKAEWTGDLDINIDESIDLVNLGTRKQAELDRIGAALRDPRRADYNRLLNLAQRNGYKPGWVAYRFKDTHGEWPPTEWSLPDPAEANGLEYWLAARDLARSRGWKDGWADHRFKELYSTWPTMDMKKALTRLNS